MIKNIEISKLDNHPNNPRKDLGDLTELVESIKANGILQNLTVVPWFSTITGVGCDDPKQQEENGYYVVIGNRRLAAAKLAGLTELPCVISDMDKKTQISTMLLENMQRVDLTVYEQAQGFQMMFDLGETVKDISQKTGFSETTIRRRTKLLELDKEKFKKSVERGATLQDYIELDKIKDVNMKNEVLEKTGTSDFKWMLQKAISDQQTEEKRNALITELEKFATRVENIEGLRTVEVFYSHNYDSFEKPADAGTEKYYFHVDNYYIQLLKEEKQTDEQKQAEADAAEERKKFQEKRAQLEETSKRAYQLRRDFIKDISNTQLKRNIEIVVESTLYSILEVFYYMGVGYEDIVAFFDISPNEYDEWDFEEIAKKIHQQPYKYLLVATYCSLDDNSVNYYDWHLRHEPNKTLDHLYDLLEALGYEMSEEEKQLRDGTHDLFESEV